MPRDITANSLFCGDNLPVLLEYIADESVDLVYLDPPFNSNRIYNVLFKDESGKEAEAQITAFEDTWHWNDAAARTYHDLADVQDLIMVLHLPLDFQAQLDESVRAEYQRLWEMAQSARTEEG